MIAYAITPSVYKNNFASETPTRRISAPAGQCWITILLRAEEQPSLEVRIIERVANPEERENGAQVLTVH
jgi:hypothetical protein